MAEPEVDIVPFHMDIHKWIAQHAPQHDDYAQYHVYCTKKLHRLAHQKDAKKYLVHSNKFVTVKVATEGGVGGGGAGGGKPKRHAFCSRRGDTFSAVDKARTNDESGTGAQPHDAEGETTNQETSLAVAVPHVNILWYLLVNAERSWANANEVQKSKGKRQTVLKKLKRAKDWADQLRVMAEEEQHHQQPKVVDPSTMKEIEAYCAWTTANFAMEKADYLVRRNDHLALYCSLLFGISNRGLCKTSILNTNV